MLNKVLEFRVTSSDVISFALSASILLILFITDVVALPEFLKQPIVGRVHIYIFNEICTWIIFSWDI